MGVVILSYISIALALECGLLRRLCQPSTPMALAQRIQRIKAMYWLKA